MRARSVDHHGSMSIFIGIHNPLLYDITDMRNQPAQVDAITAVINRHGGMWGRTRTTN
jgi:hypothetical protein